MSKPRSRRDVLRTASLTGAAGLAAGAPAHADTRRGRGVTTFVMISGANGGAWGDAELVARGHRVLPVGLPGDAGQFTRAYQCPQDLKALATQPSPKAGITLDDYVAEVVRAVRRAAGHGPVILVGSSGSGATLSRVGNVVPDLIDRIVYDTAFCCVDLASCNDYLATPEGRTSLLLHPDLQRGAVGDPLVIGASRTNWRSGDRRFLAAAKAALMAGASDAEFHTVLNGMQPDESLQVSMADARGEAGTWGRIPRTYIRHTLDRAIPLALQNRMIREADALTPANRFDVRTVRTTHVPDQAGYRQISQILDELATR